MSKEKSSGRGAPVGLPAKRERSADVRPAANVVAALLASGSVVDDGVDRRIAVAERERAETRR